MRMFIGFLLASMLSGIVNAGIRFDPVSVHPAKPQSGQPILLLLRSYWNNGCGGTLDIRVSAERIDIFQIPKNSPGVFCSDALVPFAELINPQENLTANTQFAGRVEVRLFSRNSSVIDQLLDSDIVEFTPSAPASSNVVSGSFASETLDISGLFLDQQEGVLSTLLSDYDEQGRSSWRFGAARMHGDVYVGDLSRYQQIRCITAPCPRAVAESVGKINLIALNANELFVSYRNALSPDASSATHRYQRLIFNRAATLPSVQSADAWIPDLVGEWLVGVTGNRLENADFKRFHIRYIGQPLADPGSFDRRFSAVSATNPADFFEIVCRDDRPVDGVQACRLHNYRALQRSCSASFLPTEVTLANVRIAASCDSLATELVMQRLGR